MRRKFIWKWIGSVSIVLLLILGANVWMLFSTIIKAADSIQVVDEDLYVMEYTGNYEFYKPESNIAIGQYDSSAVYIQDEYGTFFFGRNYDGTKCRTMIVHARPKNGYESISTCCLDFLDLDENNTPDGSLLDRMKCLAAIYAPLDGMNSKGLVVACLPGENDSTEMEVVRQLLDHAADVDEAVALLEQYDSELLKGNDFYVAIADEEGKSVVAEYRNGRVKVTETPAVCIGSAGETEARNLLENAAKKNKIQKDSDSKRTVWSIVYCPEGRCADFYFADNYEESYGFILSDKGSFLKRQCNL